MKKCYRLIHDSGLQGCVTDIPEQVTCSGCLGEIGRVVIKTLTKEKLDKILEEEKK